jgi:hypothetical protein
MDDMVQFRILHFYTMVSVVTEHRTRAQEKRNGIESSYFKAKHQKVILQLNAAINKYVLHILTITIFVS